MTNFIGEKYRLSNNWYNHINLNDYTNRPINYLEIGAYHGANLLSVADTYAIHPQSQLFCIDPWEDYDNYPEYKNIQEYNYSLFNFNINQSPHRNKINVIRGYSNEQILKLQNDFFDIIYIDGNHEPDYVLEDAVLSYRKLKTGGIMIFDDYGWGGENLTKRGIDSFLSGYHKKISILGEQQTQVFIKKK